MSNLDAARQAASVARPRILHVGPAPARPEGGIAAYLLGLLDSPLARLYQLEVVDTTVPPLLRRHRSLRPALSLQLAVRLSAALARRPHLVHIHMSDGAGFWEKAALAEQVHAAHRPAVLHLHGGDFERFLSTLSPLRARIAARVLGRAARVLILAVGWRPLLERFAPADRIVVCPNAIRTEDFTAAARPITSDRPRMLFLGMLSARKGLDELLAACVRLRGDGALPFECDIVGGEEVPGARALYERKFAAAGLSASVRFHGPAYGADKLRFLQQAQIFVLPSRAESFGIANLEAMAAGLAIISTRTGAIPEYLEDGVHGLLVDPGDAAGLAAAIARLTGDPDLRESLGAAARRRARDYDWSVIAARLDALYAEVISDRGSQGASR